MILIKMETLVKPEVCELDKDGSLVKPEDYDLDEDGSFGETRSL